MKDISFFKKLKFLFLYRKIIKNNKSNLETKLRIRVDDALRIYTVLNIPEELIGEAYALRKADIDQISDSYIREYIKQVSSYLNEIGLSELYRVYEINKVDKYSYLITMGFSLIKTDELRTQIFYRWIPITIITIATLCLLFLK